MDYAIGGLQASSVEGLELNSVPDSLEENQGDSNLLSPRKIVFHRATKQLFDPQNAA